MPCDWDTAFTDVSCAAGRFCLVAGYSPTKGGALTTLLYRWNGRTWTALKPAAPPKGATNPSPNGVSCATASSCMTTGSIDPNQKDSGITGRAAASVWNGRTWRATSVAAGRCAQVHPAAAPHGTV
jgi:hypothetical protein